MNNTEAASVLRQATKGSKKNTVSDLVAVNIHPILTTDGYILSVLWTAMILLYDCWAAEAKAGLVKDVNIQNVDIIQSKNMYDDDVSKNYEKRMKIIEEVIFQYVKNYMDRTL